MVFIELWKSSLREHGLLLVGDEDEGIKKENKRF